MAIGQDQDSPQTSPSVLPHVRYHPSIQRPFNPSKPNRAQSYTRTKTTASHGPRAGPAPNGTRGDSKTSKSQSLDRAYSVAERMSGNLLENSKKKSFILPEVRYHPSISVTARSPNCGKDSGPLQMKNHQSKEVRANGKGPGCVRPEGGATAEEGPPIDPAHGADQHKASRRSARRRTENGAGETSEPEQRSERNTSATARRKAKGPSPKRVIPTLNVDSGDEGESQGSSRDARTRDEDESSAKTAATAGLPLDLPEPRPGSCLDQDLVEQVEVQTRGQRTNENWFKCRKNRITASVAHSVANSRFAKGQTNTAPKSYVRTITGESRHVQTRAMTWGIEHEEEAVRKYTVQQSAALGFALSVQDCGLFIDSAKPWLAASPDGIVTDKRTGQTLRCLEVKCPFKHREHTVMAAAQEDPQFCLEIIHQEGAPSQLSLKRTHPYFTQVQCQLAVTGLKMADFVVFTERDLAVVPVQFDPDFWDETVKKLERFYTDAIIPVLRERNQGWRAEL